MTERKVDGPYDGRRLFVRTIVRKVDSAHLYRSATRTIWTWTLILRQRWRS